MKVGVIGCGFAGLAAAIAFRQGGHDVTLFERAADISRNQRGDIVGAQCLTVP